MPTLYTIGHSNHELQEYLELLKIHQISRIIDVRTIAKSRRFPWFNQQELKKTLQKNKIQYTHLRELGGLRHTKNDSINDAWENLSFRGYADYMQTPDFFMAFKKLNQFLKPKDKIAIMCAEALPWRCHRSLIADAEIIRGIKVLHIINKSHPLEHQLTSFAVVDKTKRPIKIFYPKRNKQLTLRM